jgi:hypothetical protein
MPLLDHFLSSRELNNGKRSMSTFTRRSQRRKK